MFYCGSGSPPLSSLHSTHLKSIDRAFFCMHLAILWRCVATIDWVQIRNMPCLKSETRFLGWSISYSLSPIQWSPLPSLHSSFFLLLSHQLFRCSLFTFFYSLLVTTAAHPYPLFDFLVYLNKTMGAYLKTYMLRTNARVKKKIDMSKPYPGTIVDWVD